MHLPRMFIRALCAFGGAWSAASAQEAIAGAAPVRHWTVSTRVETSVGYKDNVLLSADNEQKSTFLRGGAEALLLGLPPGRFEYTVYARADQTHYFSGEAVDDDTRVWLEAEVGFGATDWLKLSLPVRGYYFDEVYDASETQFERRIVETKFSGIAAGPTVRWTFHPRVWIEAQALADRKRYEGHTEDNEVGEGTLRLGWKLGDRMQVRLAGIRRWYDYEYRVQYNSAGRPLADTELRVAEEQADLRFDVEWGAARQWKTSTRVAALRYRDNGSGYFSHRRGRLAQEVEWENDSWLIRLAGAGHRIEWDVQTVGIGIQPPARIKDEYSGELRIERRLSPRWTAYCAYSWERSRSNEAIASYRVNEGLLGARWNWDK